MTRMNFQKRSKGIASLTAFALIILISHDPGPIFLRNRPIWLMMLLSSFANLPSHLEKNTPGLLAKRYRMPNSRFQR